MRHVIVETNWVVDWAAPAHHREPTAVDLHEAALGGLCHLHLPAISIAEARRVIPRKFRLSEEIGALKRFAGLLVNEGRFAEEDRVRAQAFLNLFEGRVKRDFEALEGKLLSLRKAQNIEVFALSEAMLERSIALSSTHGVELEPFDNAILAAVLERAAELRAGGAVDVVFATLDAHLLPWFRKTSKPREELQGLYASVGLQVVDGFDKALESLNPHDEE
jgi:hypothetical protein